MPPIKWPLWPGYVQVRLSKVRLDYKSLRPEIHLDHALISGRAGPHTSQQHNQQVDPVGQAFAVPAQAQLGGVLRISVDAHPLVQLLRRAEQHPGDKLNNLDKRGAEAKRMELSARDRKVMGSKPGSGEVVFLGFFLPMPVGT